MPSWLGSPVVVNEKQGKGAGKVLQGTLSGEVNVVLGQEVR